MKLICSGTIGTQMPLETVFQTVHALGFQEIDLLMVTGWAHLDLDQLVLHPKEITEWVAGLLHKYELKIGAVNAKYSVRLEDIEPDKVHQRQLEFDAMLRFMDHFGVTHVSVQPTLTDDTEYLARTYDAFLTEMVRQQKYAKEHGRLLSMETHINSAVCTKKAIAKVLRAYPDLQFTYDPSHLLYNGESMADTAVMFPNTTLVHLRDAKKDALFVPAGEGLLDVDFILENLKAKGYDGPIVLEYLSDLEDPVLYRDLLRFASKIRAYQP